MNSTNKGDKFILFSVIVLIGFLLYSVFVYLDIIPPLFNRGFSFDASASYSYGKLPCPVKGQNGSNPKYVQESKITVNVLNGSGLNGIASQVALKLKQKKYKIGNVANSSFIYNGNSLILSGRNGVNSAWTLRADSSKDSTISTDQRQDSTLDFIIGKKFNGLSTENKNLSGQEIIVDQKCTNLGN